MRKSLVGVLAAALCLTALAPAAAATVHTTVPVRAAAAALPLSDTAYAANAFGTSLVGKIAGVTVTSGPTAFSIVACTKKPNVTRTNGVASVNTPVFTTGAVTSKSQSLGTAASRTAQSNASVAGVNLLGGLVTAGALTSASSSTVTAAGAASGTNASGLVNLKVGGVPIAANVAPNTKLNLNVGGSIIGKITINGQTKTTQNGLVRAQTRAVEIQITANNPFGLSIGSRIVVAQSTAALVPAPIGFAGGHAYSLKASLANGTVHTGPIAYLPVPCAGGSSTANTAGVTLPGIVTLGVTTTTTSSTTVPTLKAQASNTVASASVLAGLISASAIKASTETRRATKTAPATFVDNSSFGTLKILGLPLITPSVPPNTTVPVPGLGAVTLRKTVTTAKSIRVTMIHVVLGLPLGGLPAGSIIEIGVSQTSVS